MNSCSRIAILGGSFDPPHLGHLFVMNSVLDARIADELWIMPSGARWDKPNATPCHHRVAMAELMIQEFFSQDRRVSLSLEDASCNDGNRGTAGLLAELAMKYPHFEFLFVIGHELLGDLPRWRSPELLRSLAHFVVVERAGMPPTSHPEGFRITSLPSRDAVTVSISSSLVRKRQSAGGEIRGLVPASVYRYLVDHRIYETASPQK